VARTIPLAWVICFRRRTCAATWRASARVRARPGLGSPGRRADSDVSCRRIDSLCPTSNAALRDGNTCMTICPMAVRHRSSVRCSSLHDHRLEPLLVPEKDLACGMQSLRAWWASAPRLGEWRFSGTHTSTPRRCGTGTQCDGASLECRTTTQSWNLNTESRSSKCPSPFSSYTSHEHQRRTILAEGLAYCFVHRGRRWLGAVPAAVAVM
jgi:hypothetical protein